MWERRFVRAILRHRIAVIATVAALSVVAAIFASRVRMDSSIEIWFLEDDPTLVSYRQFLDRFGGDEFSVVAVFADDVFSPQSLAAVDQLTEAARQAPFVEDAILRTMTETGQAIIMTSVVLAAGFSILGLGNFSPNIYFGVVTAVVVLLALAADLLVLPAALLIMRPAFPGQRD